MPSTLFAKICRLHGIDCSAAQLSLLPDQVLIHDALGTPVCLQMEAIGRTCIKPLLAMYCDHNTLQVGYRNDDDHAYMYGMAKRLGAYFFRPGEGICHQTHLEQFARPGGILLGADSHTPTCGAVGMLSIGVGGLTVVGALCDSPYRIARQKVVGVELTGTLRPWCTAKDIALRLLGMLSVKGGVGKILEFRGDGLAGLTVFDRATICNMGAEAGATGSLFPSDEQTRRFLRSFGREEDWVPLAADAGADYDEDVSVDLSDIVPMVAMPASPDNVCPVREIEGMHLDQVFIGSCTNASYTDIAVVSEIWSGHRLPADLDVSIAAGTRKTMFQLIRDGKIESIVDAGARVLEACCGPCNAAGMSPGSGRVSLRTINRNFKGRSGTPDGQVYLCSPHTAAVSALHGTLRDPRGHGKAPAVVVPETFSYRHRPERFSPDPEYPLVHGPNIKPMPMGTPIPDSLTVPVKLIAGDNVTTDHILPGGSELLALRSNVPANVPYLFERIDPHFRDGVGALPAAWCVVGGENYGQGSSREHAVMVPLYIGMRAVLAKSFARIYRRNLLNFGVLPLEYPPETEFRIDDELVVEHIHASIGSDRFTVVNKTKGTRFECSCVLSDDERDLLRAGGILNRLASGD